MVNKILLNSDIVAGRGRCCLQHRFRDEYDGHRVPLANAKLDANVSQGRTNKTEGKATQELIGFQQRFNHHEEPPEATEQFRNQGSQHHERHSDDGLFDGDCRDVLGHIECEFDGL
jgi:hypothetical protein